MALTATEQVKLEIGLVGLDQNDIPFGDPEIQYFLEKHNQSVKRASLDCAKSILFILSRYVKEVSGPELQLYGNQWFENYMKALKLYIQDPNYSIAISMAQAYAGGISKSDASANMENSDNIYAEVEKAYPQDYEASSSRPVNYFDSDLYFNTF